jgi:hypothetical protein
MSRPLLALLSVTLAAGCGGGASDPDGPLGPGVDAAPRETVMETKPLLVGEIVEATLVGGADDRAVIHLAAPRAQLDWNIHGHVGGTTENIVEALDQMTVDYTFEPPEQADWSLLLRNGDPAPMDIEIRIDLYGEMTWSGWQ